MNRVNVFAINRCINEGYGLIRIFTEKNTDFPHEIVACLQEYICPGIWTLDYLQLQPVGKKQCIKCQLILSTDVYSLP